MITSVTFDTAIGGDYKRNNRSTRQKSLRCFPSCGIKGHVTGGFCGLPLKVTIEITRESNVPEFVPEDYRFIAEIRPVSQPRISGAKHILEADLLRQIRSKYEKNEANGELFQADNINVVSSSSSGTEMELTFNSQHCSWDYSWKSNRWSGPQEQHVVDIIALKSISALDTRVVSFVSSTPFVVSSSHKKPVKTNQIKDEDDEETICLPAKARRANGRTDVRVDEGPSRLSSMNTSTLTMIQNADIRGAFEQPRRRQLVMSADGKTLEFAEQKRSLPSEEEEPTDQETLHEGAMSLLQLAAKASSHAPVQAPTAAPALVPEAQSAVRKDKKTAEAAHKRVKVEEAAAPDMHHPYGYHAYPPYQYPGYPPFPPYPYPYPYPPPPGDDGGEGSSLSTPHYPEHDYAAHLHRYPPPVSHPSYMYPYPPYGYGLHPPPPPPQGSKHAVQPQYGMLPPYGMGAYPPHPMHYAAHLPYPSAYRPAPASSSSSSAATAAAALAAAATQGERSECETASDAEESLAVVARRLTGSTKPAPSSRAASEAPGASELPVAVPVPVGSGMATALAVALEGEQKALKFTKRTQRFGGAAAGGGGAGPAVTWDGRIAEAPAVRSIAPLERARAGSSGSSGSATGAGSSIRAPATNSGSVTP